MKTSLSRARVGFLVLIGVITFAVATFLVGEKTQLFSSTFMVKVNFSNAEGVKTGTFVVLSGYSVGSVSDIQLTPFADSVRLTLRINEDIHPFIKADSKAEIKQEGLVGNKIINLLIGSAALPPVTPGGFIQGVPPFALTGLADNMTAIMDTTKMITGELNTMLHRLNSGEGTIGQLLTNDAMYRNLESITARADTGMALATAQLNRLTDMLARIAKNVDGLSRRSDSAISSVTDVTTELTTLVRNLNEGKGTAGALLSDRSLYDSLLTVVGSLSAVTYDAGNAANQLAQSMFAMRQHWLFGRVFGGGGIDKESAPTPAYRKMMRDVNARAAELEKREQRIRERERELGIPSAPGEK
ncbi:MAG: MCE family protein [Ignavibacteria bacterium]|nr:MCE family protein [Ignavibacteria bacterium]